MKRKLILPLIGAGSFGLLVISCNSVASGPGMMNRAQHAYAMAPASAVVPSASIEIPSSGNKYGETIETPFVKTSKEDTSTFSVDVDTAAYSQIRRMLEKGNEVPKDLVRIEEMLNYFSYDYAAPDSSSSLPFKVHLSGMRCPWEKEDYLLRVGIQGKELEIKERKASNLVFLIDTSGSMHRSDKLPLLQKSFKMLLKELNGNDTVSIVTYAGSTRVALKPTKVSDFNQLKIMAVIEDLDARGSTFGSGGIQLAYKAARKNFRNGGVNRVILATDGDFNVGVSDKDELVDLIKEKAASGIELSVIGFGDGNLNDEMMESITNAGNGNYHYIDSELEAKRALAENFGGTIHTIAKDVKIQTVFKANAVESYRLIGYSNRRLANEDFDNDKVDAGEIGSGHSVTALYQLKLKPQALGSASTLGELRLRYKAPKGGSSKLLKTVIASKSFKSPVSQDDQFAAAVALFGLLLRDSEYKGTGSFGQVSELATAGLSSKDRAAKQEFVKLVKKAD